MGLTVGPSYTTDEGFVLPAMYLTIDSFRLVRTLSNDVFGCTFTVAAYQSRDSFHGGSRPIKIPQHLGNCETFIRAADFYSQTMYGIAYQRIKEVWQGQGYTLTDIHEGTQPMPSTFIYDASGYTFFGFNPDGWDRDGYNALGFNAGGLDKEGYTVQGFNAEGYNRQGFDSQGFNRNGYDYQGYNKDGFNVEGFNFKGFNAEGLNAQGLTQEQVQAQTNP